MMHPVGPRSPQTYWVRRVLVVAVAVVLIAGVVWLVFGRGSAKGSADRPVSTTAPTTTKLTGVLAAADTVADSSADRAGDGAADGAAAAGSSGAGSTALGAPVTSGSATSGTVTSGRATTGSSASKTTTKAAVTSTTPTTASTGPAATKKAAATSTAKAAVTVTVTRPATTKPAAPKTTASKPAAPKTTAPPKPSYDSAGRLLCPVSSIRLAGTIWGATAGGQPRVGMKATNIGTQPCQFNASGAAPVYTVSTAAGAHVWSQADCFPSPAYPETRLGVGQQATDVIIWAGTTSAPGKCAPGDRHPVKAGKYVLTVHLGPITSAPLPFTLQ